MQVIQMHLQQLGVNCPWELIEKAPLTDLYSADVINNIVAGLDTANRWGC
jgi:hypothetical protein